MGLRDGAGHEEGARLGTAIFPRKAGTRLASWDLPRVAAGYGAAPVACGLCAGAKGANAARVIHINTPGGGAGYSWVLH